MTIALDPRQFDHFSKRLAARSSRRAIGGIGLAGFFGALLRRPIAAAGSVTCAYRFTATVDLPEPENGKQPIEVSGDLTLTIGADGAIERSTLVTASGATAQVSGQANGRAISLKIDLAGEQSLITAGAAAKPITTCPSVIRGMTTGPEPHQLGDWSASIKREPKPTATVPPAAGATLEPEPVPDGVATAPCALKCDPKGVALDEATCTCLCDSTQTMCVTEVDESTGSQLQAVCTDLTSDPGHCGSCDFACPSGLDLNIDLGICTDGTCSFQCIPPFGSCFPGDQCTTDLDDDANCGECGNVCPGRLACNDGVCDCGNSCLGTADYDSQACLCLCHPGFTACEVNLHLDRCVDLATDSDNCGACGVVCGPITSICQAGECIGASRDG